MFVKPSFKNIYGPEIRNNLIKRCGESLSEKEVIQEGIFYACDMCLEFLKQSGGFLPEDWIRHIASEVYCALKEYVMNVTTYKENFILKVLTIMSDPKYAQALVNKYYNY